MEQIINDRLLSENLFERLRELDPDADKIIKYWIDAPTERLQDV